MHGLSETAGMLPIIFCNIMGSQTYTGEANKQDVKWQVATPLICDMGVCDNPAISMIFRRRVNPSWDGQLWVIAETWDPESISALHGIQCPHLSRIRI